jgi:glycerol-3-phosphate dehydrogenase (NAD+)
MSAYPDDTTKRVALGADSPPPHAVSIWQHATVVCFDVDCTVCKKDSMDMIAEFVGADAAEVEKITNQAMDGALSLEEALQKRMDIINPTPAIIKSFHEAHSPESRLCPGIAELIAALHDRGVIVYLISGGFRELTLPVAKLLSIPFDRVFANRMFFQNDDITQQPTVFAGFDFSQPTAHAGGKPKAIQGIRTNRPFETIIMIGDGITDLEAAEEEGAADLFIAYTGIISRPNVVAGASWAAKHFDELRRHLKRHRVAYVGSGAWACASARMAAQTCRESSLFETDVAMWVYDEKLEDGRMLTDVMNEKHENVKYLPGVDIGANIIAYPDLLEAVKNADVICICAPHQFVHRICVQMQGNIKPSAIAISLTKGMRIRAEGPQLVSAMVRSKLGIDCSVLMGPNIAEEVAAENLCEATIGYRQVESARVLQKLFERPYFSVACVLDIEGCELCGTLKNIVALSAGFTDGLGCGANTKAVILRVGLSEMRRFAKALYPSVQDETLMESCGIADLIATCFGGRNRRVAEAFTKEQGKKSFTELEADLLSGQKLQGVLTSNEVQSVLVARGWLQQFPLFVAVNDIVNGRATPDVILKIDLKPKP